MDAWMLVVTNGYKRGAAMLEEWKGKNSFNLDVMVFLLKRKMMVGSSNTHTLVNAQVDVLRFLFVFYHVLVYHI